MKNLKLVLVVLLSVGLVIILGLIFGEQGHLKSVCLSLLGIILGFVLGIIVKSNFD